MSTETVHILIADDHPVVRMGVRNMLEREYRFRVVAEAGDGAEAVSQVDALQPDVLLLDLSMPKFSGMEALQELAARKFKTRTIVLTASIDKAQILEALCLGARGIVSKRALLTELHECVHAVLEDKFWILGTSLADPAELLEKLAGEISAARKTFGLAPRELQITALVAEGCTNRDAAAECGIGEETVKHHLKRIFDKTGVSNRLELAVFAMNHALTRSY